MHIEITTQGFELTQELEKYAHSKLARISRRIPRVLREDAMCTVQFTRSQVGEGKTNACSLNVTAGDKVFAANETTQHMYAALDIVTAQVEQQLKNYRAGMRKPSVVRRMRRTFHVL